MPRTYGWQDNLQINIDMLFNMQNFISYKEFHSMFYCITEGKIPAESSYLRFRHDILNNFGPVNKGKKYPPPIKFFLEEWVFQSPIELFRKTKKGSKNYRKIFLQNKVTLQKNSWEKTIGDPSISINDVNKKLEWLSKSELSQDIVDRNQRLLYRKTQFRDQLVHHNNPDIKDNFCEHCLKNSKDRIILDDIDDLGRPQGSYPESFVSLS